jgi:hypothetical protein
LIADTVETDDGSYSGRAEVELHEEAIGGLQDALMQWMTEHDGEEQNTIELSEDFGKLLQPLGCSHAVPLDRLRAVVGAVVIKSCRALDPSVLQPQLVRVAEHVKPLLGKWHLLLSRAFTDVGDTSMATAAAIAAVQRATTTSLGSTRHADLAMLGIAMSLRDLIEDIGDEHLLAGCKQLQPCSLAVKKFIDFLSDDYSDQGSDDS